MKTFRTIWRVLTTDFRQAPVTSFLLGSFILYIIFLPFDIAARNTSALVWRLPWTVLFMFALIGIRVLPRRIALPYLGVLCLWTVVVVTKLASTIFAASGLTPDWDLFDAHVSTMHIYGYVSQVAVISVPIFALLGWCLHFKKLAMMKTQRQANKNFEPTVHSTPFGFTK